MWFSKRTWHMLDYLKYVQVLHGTQLKNTRIGFQDIIIVDDHYDFDELAEFLAPSRTPRLVIQMFFTDPPPVAGHHVVFLPLWIDVARNMLCKTHQRWRQQFDTLGCFNFMIYKQRPWRLLALKIIEQQGLHTDFYTSTVEHDRCDVPVSEHHGLDLATPWQTAPRWFGERRIQSYDYEDHYMNHLAREVFDPVAVSLITEPIESNWTELSTFTEKSLYPVLSCNLPIWLGGRNQHRYWQELGFDAFEDVLDCSYQDHDDPVQRMQMALSHNREILTNLDLARSTRQRLMPRLLANRERFLELGFRDYMQRCRANVPERFHRGWDQYLEHVYARSA